MSLVVTYVVTPDAFGDGTVTLTVPSDNPPYSFLWSDGSTDQNRVGLSSGSYGVTVTDASSEVSLDIIVPTAYDSYLAAAMCCYKSKVVCALNLIQGGNLIEYLEARATALILWDMIDILTRSTWNNEDQCLTNSQMIELLQKISQYCGCQPIQLLPPVQLLT